MSVRVVILAIFIFLNFSNFGQSIVDEIDEQKDQDISGADLPSETIEKMSASRRVLILSNSSQSFNKGDFISLVLDNQLLNRAIVAKVSGGSAGIKIIKVYNEQLNKFARAGTKVKVIRGDDSFFGRKTSSSSGNNNSTSLIDDEDDLFDETTLLSDDLNLEKNSSRLIRTDNLVFATFGNVASKDADGNSKSYLLYGVSGAFQFKDNFWGELSLNRGNVSDLPITGQIVSFTTYIVRLKYTISAPSYSYLQPYIGFKSVSVGGVVFSENDDTAAAEEEVINDIEKSSIIFGVTLLKRLVPGWFARLDLGNDLLALGFGLEF
jgi:hypothetical protein